MAQQEGTARALFHAQRVEAVLALAQGNRGAGIVRA